jgi:hypothetical protein
MGPAPGSIKGRGETQRSQSEQPAPQPRLSDTKPKDQPPSAAEEKQERATKEAECSNDNQNYHDCVIQLRTARATERQARVAWDAALVAGAALFFAAIAAGAALWTVHTMRDTARRELRAYVCLQSGSVTWDHHYVVVANATFRNSGQTPGFQFMTWAKVTIDDASACPFTDAPSLEERAQDGRSIIAPHSDAHIMRRVTPAPLLEDVEAVGTGRKAIFFWGRVDYVDAFDEERHFIFRCRVTGRHEFQVDIGGAPNIGWSLAPDAKGYESN